MLENIIAAGVAVVVGGGLLTLVYRILRGDRQSAKLEEELAALAKDKPQDKPPKKKKKKK